MACHGSIDPLGFAFENFDGAGACRTMDGGEPVDASGEIKTTDVDGAFDDAIGLTPALAGSQHVRDCMTAHWLQFALSRDTGKQDRGQLASLAEGLNASGGNLRGLITDIAAGEILRQGPRQQ